MYTVPKDADFKYIGLLDVANVQITSANNPVDPRRRYGCGHHD